MTITKRKVRLFFPDVSSDDNESDLDDYEDEYGECYDSLDEVRALAE